MNIIRKIIHYLGPNSPLGLVTSGLICGLLLVGFTCGIDFLMNLK